MKVRATASRQPALAVPAEPEAGLVAPRIDQAQGWQPIATAPRDGTEIDLWWPAQIGREGRREANVHWNKFDGFWRRRDRTHCIYGIKPTHWMPLPPAPETSA